MRSERRKIALERMGILVRAASSNIASDPALAARQAAMARRISSRHRVRMPYELRMAFCRRCKSFIGYGTHSRIRLGAGAVRITCGFCGRINSKILPQ